MATISIQPAAIQSSSARRWSRRSSDISMTRVASASSLGGASAEPGSSGSGRGRIGSTMRRRARLERVPSSAACASRGLDEAARLRDQAAVRGDQRDRGHVFLEQQAVEQLLKRDLVADEQRVFARHRRLADVGVRACAQGVVEFAQAQRGVGGGHQRGQHQHRDEGDQGDARTDAPLVDQGLLLGAARWGSAGKERAGMSATLGEDGTDRWRGMPPGLAGGAPAVVHAIFHRLSVPA